MWSLKRGGHSWQWSLKTGTTVHTLPKLKATQLTSLASELSILTFLLHESSSSPTPMLADGKMVGRTGFAGFLARGSLSLAASVEPLLFFGFRRYLSLSSRPMTK